MIEHDEYDGREETELEEEARLEAQHEAEMEEEVRGALARANPAAGESAAVEARIRANLKLATIGGCCEVSGFDDDMLRTMPADLYRAYMHFSAWETCTPCGEECLTILERAGELFAVCDPASHRALWLGVIEAMAVICMG